MSQSVNKVNYEDVQFAIQHKNYIILNTMNKHEQNILIHGTIKHDKEEDIINGYINNPNIHIIIYDRNSCENRPLEKYNQLMKLGFNNIYIYPGGIFEWLLLQDIYGNDNFPTSSQERDILKFKGNSRFNTYMLGV